ncbi:MULTISPECIES: 2,3-diaminopropionate biosynthesis protein SbnA [Amycolatopsis]|uniref:N-(2-amino-2-carboxyethyl)-L-glutamate synthase n=1 Tax=Amycolatopsis bullii TaxID=941987 RepID=A0ABQ3JYT6_9PSEU|nr:2,3-diaminopropionate biosynthesis protein SbnA [Amycolatopsis bullii]GHF91610.1 2,3-diaminopropionate biosynthesis protein SbnA [Amycolatopsis bullii]
MSTAEIGGVLATIGGTPLVALDRIGKGLRVFAKMEKFNPGGSVKDRTALHMLQGALRAGALVPGRSVVVESTSGNLGVGLAQLCAYFGLDLVCVVDTRTTAQTIALLRAYGATVELVTEPVDGDLLGARIARVRELLAQLPDAFWPDQYANPLNPAAHEQTMREIADALDGRVDYLFCSVSTGGTMRGCADYIRRHGLTTELVAVDAAGSAIFHVPTEGRLLPGHGAGRRPPLVDPSAVREVVHVTDLECVRACRDLVAREAILAGGSSGATVAALGKLRDRIPAGSVCVLVFPDDGNRYLDTIYSDHWVREHFGELPAPASRALAALP